VKPNEVLALRVFVTAKPQDLTAPSLPAKFEAKAGPIRAETKTVFLSGAASAP